MRDLARTEAIERLGWDVLRVGNEEVVGDIDAVIARTRRAARAVRG